MMAPSAGSGDGLAGLTGCRSSSGGWLSTLSAQAHISGFSSHSVAAAQQQRLLAAQGATLPARSSASSRHVMPGSCITVQTLGSAPVREPSIVRRSLSALQLPALAAVGGVQKSLHSQTNMPTVHHPRGATRDALNRIADTLRGGAVPADGRASCSEAGNATARCTPEERAQKIARYRAKRDRRNFHRSVKYQCRKTLADSRPRIKGRFARDGEPGSVLPDEQKAQKDQQKQVPRSAPQQQERQQHRVPDIAAATTPIAYSLPSLKGLTLQEAYYLATCGGNSSISNSNWQQHTHGSTEQQLQQARGDAAADAAGTDNLWPVKSSSSLQQETLLEASGAAAALTAPLVTEHISMVSYQVESLTQSTVSAPIKHCSSASVGGTAAGGDYATDDDFILLAAMLLQD